MAIIKGMKTADMGSITPYNEDIDKLASGVMAREGRAEETRNAIADARNQMLLKETRDNSEDMALAQKLEQGFTSEVDVMLDKADADYSMISKGDLQRLAGDYMGKTEWRALTNAKIQTDIYNDEKRKAEAAGGSSTIFGTDPNTVSLYDNEGNINHLTGTFEVQKTLDHSQAAKDLFDSLGTKLEAASDYNRDPEKHTHDSWLLHFRNWMTEDESNIDRVNSIIDGGLDGFLTDPEGKQYYRIHYENQKDLEKSHEEADAFAKAKVRSLIRTYGESEYIDKDTEKYDFKSQVVPNTNTNTNRGKGSSTPSDEPINHVNNSISKQVTYDGIIVPGDSVIEFYQSLHAIPTATQISQTVNGGEHINHINNNNVVVGAALMVKNPADPNNNDAGTTGQVAGVGGLMKLENQVPQNQKSSVLSINTNYTTISKIEDTEKDLKSEIALGSTETQISGLETKLLNQKLNLVSSDNYKNLYKAGKLTDLTIEKIVAETGDNLFQKDDVIKMLADNYQFEENSSEMDKNVYQSLKTDFNTKGWKSGAISTFSTNEKEDKLGIVISPFLEKMKSYYNNQLLQYLSPNQIAANGDPILDENGNLMYDKKYLGQVTLLNAQIQHVDNKIKKANKFLETYKPAIDTLKSKYSFNYYKERNLNDRLTNIARKNNFTDAEIEAGLHLGLNQKLGAKGESLVKIERKINSSAEKEAGLNFNDADNNIKYYRDKLKAIKERNWSGYSGGIDNKWISEKGNESNIDYALEHINTAEIMHDKYRKKILENKYTLDDIKATKWYEENKENIEKNGLSKYLTSADGSTPNKARYMGMYTSLLEKEFEGAGLRNIDPATGELDKKYGRAVNYTINSLLGVISFGNDTGPIQTGSHILSPAKILYDDEEGKLKVDLTLNEDISKEKSNSIKKVYKGQAHVLNYLKDVNDLQKQMDRNSILFLLSEDLGNKDGKFWENKKNAMTLEFNTKGIRKVIYSDKEGDGEREHKTGSYKQHIKNTLQNAWSNYEKGTGSKTEGEFKKEWKISALKGIRLDYTNEGPIFVAHYEDEASGLKWEHNTESVTMSEAMEKFGIEGARIKYTQLFSNSLFSNGGGFADLPNFSNKKPIRIHLATDNKGSDINGNAIIRGQYFMMQKRPADKTPEDYPGKTSYATSNIGQYDLIAFPTYDAIFTHIRNANSTEMNRVEQLQKQIAVLESGKYHPGNYFEEASPLHDLTTQDAITELKKMVNITITGKSSSVNNTTATTGTTVNKLPQNFQLPGS